LPDFIFDGVRLSISRSSISCVGKKNEVIQSNAIDIFADDVIETENHFRCIDMIIAHAKAALTEKRI